MKEHSIKATCFVYLGLNTNVPKTLVLEKAMSVSELSNKGAFMRKFLCLRCKYKLIS
jgi:hypothetical protein